MPTPLETFRAWERDAPRTVVHVMIIDRGDGSAANRLTLTDKPYYDKGVSGTKYHETYPAPIHCIISDIQTEEEESGSRFDDIILANGDGRLNGILDGEVIATKAFTILRGDTRWSILDDEYPERFTEVCRGTVESVIFDRAGGRVRLAIGPIKYSLDNTVASPTLPLAVGYCYNVPATLVSAADLKYRVSSIVQGTGSRFDVLDNGVELALTTDYTIILEDEDLVEDVSGKFRGKFQLLAAPSGTVTANVNYSDGLGLGIWLITRQIRNNFFPTYISAAEKYDPSSTVGSRSIYFKPDGTKLYVGGVRPDLERRAFQFSLSTPWDLSTISYDSKSRNFSAQLGDTNPNPVPTTIQISDDGETLYMLSSDGVFYQYALGTAWDLSTGSYADSLDLTTLGLDAGQCKAMYIHENTVYVVETKDVYRLTMTAGDITTLASPELMLTLDAELGAGVAVSAIDFSADGKKFYYVDSSSMLMLRQLEVLTAWDLSETFYSGRSYFYEHYSVSMLNINLSSFRMAPGGTKFFTAYTYGSLYTIDEFSGITNSDFPRDLLRSRPDEREVGVFYNSETKIGQVLADLARSIGRTFYVARDGAIVLSKEQSASAAITAGQLSIDISLADMIGEGGEHIKHAATLPPLAKVSTLYKRNFNPISQSTSAGSLTVAQKDELATEYLVRRHTNTLTNYEEAADEELDTFCVDIFDAQDVGYARGEFRSVPRLYLDIQLSLGAISVLTSLDVGGVLRIVGDVKHPALEDGDYVMLTRRRINWTKNQQTLTVHK